MGIVKEIMFEVMDISDNLVEIFSNRERVSNGDWQACIEGQVMRAIAYGRTLPKERKGKCNQ